MPYRQSAVIPYVTAAPDVSRASGNRRQRDDSGTGKGAKRLKVEPKVEHGTGANGALVPPPPQHLLQHAAQTVSNAHVVRSSELWLPTWAVTARWRFSCVLYIFTSSG